MSDGLKIEGLDELGRKFGKLAEKTQAKIAGQATNFAMTPALKKAREVAPRLTGFTAENLAKRTKRYPHKDVAVTVVGVKKYASTEVNGKPHRPANIEHLIHDGFINAMTGEFVPGVPWTIIAMSSEQNNVKSRLMTKLGREIEKATKALK